MSKYLISILFLLLTFQVIGQRGKDGDYTVGTTGEVVNTYTHLTATGNSGSTSLQVANNQMGGAGFSGNLQAGDLLLIYQMKGVTVDINTYPTVGWLGSYTVQSSFFSNGNVYSYLEFGEVTNYKSAGFYQFVEVESVQGTSIINITCELNETFLVGTHDHCQVIRIPRYENLTVPANTEITSPAWNGTTGGVVAVEVEKDMVVNGSINTDAKGFRGGNAVNTGTASSSSGNISTINDRGYVGSNSPDEGSEKGESIFGDPAYYNSEWESRYGYGAIANGGGGGGYHNAGGGGGSNVGNGNYYGYGVVDRGPGNSYDPAWNLENPNMISQPSAGGGRGGYSGVANNRDPLIVGPHEDTWGLDFRRITGGVGGHPLTYDVTRVFMGGGGGAGHGNDNYAGNGGNGGGSVFLTIYGETLGGGSISANGGDGESTEAGNPSPNGQTGGDGGGGAGGGGAIVIKNSTALPASLELEAKGGKGGDEVIKTGFIYNGFQSHGPGGGGAGGMIAVANGAPNQDVSGGASGIVSSSSLSGHIFTKFPVNGATKGAAGMDFQFAEFVDILVDNDTICEENSVTITPTIVGTGTYGDIQWYNSYDENIPFHTGNSYTTPTLNVNTTYYLGFCDVPFRVPVTIVVSPDIIISGTAVTGAETCAGNDGTVTGLVASGGTGALTYEWNGSPSVSVDLVNATGGSYTLTVTDENSCVATSGPHVVGDSPGPSIDITNMSISDETCAGNDGAITGITASGGTGTLAYEWNGVPSVSIDLANATGGSYTLTITDASGCVSTAGPFTVGTDPAVVIDESNVVVTNESCHGNDGSITGILASGVTGTLTYSWAPNGETTSDIAGLSAGTYTLTVSDGNNCTAVSSAYEVQVTPGITLDASNVVVNDASCGNNNGSITGIVVNGGTAPYVYEWNGTITPTVNLTNAAPGTYSLTVTDNNGCTETIGTYIIDDMPGLIADVSGVQITNETCDGGDASITGIVVSGGTAPYSFSWNGVPSNTEDLINAASGTYNFTATDVNGCTVSEGPYVLNGAVLPSISITSPDQEIEYGESVTISTASSPTGTSFLWSPADGLNCVTCDEVIATPETSTWYVVTATSVDGCTASDSIFIKVIDPCNEAQFPTVFSPNGDGLNDFYCILGGCFNYMELRIYNRWGELMFLSTDSSDCWDGTFRGEKVNTGAYAYYFTGMQVDGKEVAISGNINLIR